MRQGVGQIAEKGAVLVVPSDFHRPVVYEAIREGLARMRISAVALEHFTPAVANQKLWILRPAYRPAGEALREYLPPDNVSSTELGSHLESLHLWRGCPVSAEITVPAREGNKNTRQSTVRGRNL